MPHFEEALKGERKIREMEAESFKFSVVHNPDNFNVEGMDTVLVQPDPNAHLGATSDE